MRRIIIIFFWLFKSRNNVSFSELLHFITKPTVRNLGSLYIKEIEEIDLGYKVTFNTITSPLYWPKECPIDGLFQVTAETFDISDWHYYQKPETVVRTGDIVLDIGAAEGLFALRVISVSQKIIMIEPNDYFFKTLKKTFSPFEEKVTIHNVAVGNTEGEISFDQDSLSGRINSQTGNANIKKITKIDTLLGPQTRITYLKADLEGYELEMLKGAQELIVANKPAIAITTYHTENDAQAIIDFIKGVVPEYRYMTKGVFHKGGKPVMIHFWID